MLSGLWSDILPDNGEVAVFELENIWATAQRCSASARGVGVGAKPSLKHGRTIVRRAESVKLPCPGALVHANASRRGALRATSTRGTCRTRQVSPPLSSGWFFYT